MRTEALTPTRPGSVSVETASVYASRLSLLVLTVAFAVAYVGNVTASLETQMMLYLVGMVALNLPHGGYEHLSNLRHRGLPFGARYVTIYLVAVAGFVALFFVAPIPALAVAFATAVAKGGHGDLQVMDALVGTDHLRYSFQRALAALVRGGAIMIVPLALWQDTYIAFSSFMISIFDPGKVGPLVERIEFGAPLLLGGYALAVVAHLGGGYLTAEQTDPWLWDAGETLLLIVYFLIVPVVISIGLYFPLWYSMRQSGRSVLAHRESPDDREGLPMPAVWAAFIGGALATGTLAALLWWLVPNPLGDATLLPGLVAFYTIFVCIIALPHVVVGHWLDRTRGIWYVP
jgi:Brp/Blh family beta-carotene 15,15'-monooxygenase